MKETLRQISMIIIECILFGGLAFMFYGIVGGLLVRLNLWDVETLIGGADHLNPWELLVDFIPLFFATLFATVAVHRYIFKRSFAFSGFRRQGLFRQTLDGANLAMILLLIGFIILMILGYYQIVKVQMVPWLFIGFLIMFLVQSSFEELVMRSFLLPTIADRTNIYWSLGVTSVGFALLHLFNDSMGVIPMINLVLAGGLLGALYLAYRSIWAPIGMHFAWNFLQGSFFGFEVSGHDVYSYIDSKETGPDLITGGAFGFEGSIIATLLLIGATYFIVDRYPEKFNNGTYLCEEVNVALS